ncbi:uncharacterized protein C6orf118 homolog [Pteronotus mesoamericanus]|uniref:uncharacterized protein C6orf118 homolog n=1 Tax=Pteronotus mesoamericanus TaxID=1884717 RepID=UPI0023ED499D|nr:uncharacterized protein C6orf118 homolog [Pteronotus parnellii mesoamericanus]
MAEESQPQYYLRWKHCEDPGVRTLCNLAKLLNKLEQAHKDDIALYTSGHLNPNKLYRPPETILHHWRNATGPRGRGGRREGKPRDKGAAAMKDAWAYFTVNTALGPNEGPGTALSRYLNPPAGALCAPEEDVLPGPAAGAEGAVQRQRGALRWWPGALEAQAARSGRECTTSPPGPDEHVSVGSYLAGLTKADRFRRLLRFQRDVLGTQDLLVNDFTGRRAARRHEKKLEQELRRGCLCGPHNKLQVLSSIFADVCNSSLLFGDILKEVKDEYELYMAILLHTRPAERFQTLLADAEGLERRPVTTAEVRQAREQLQALVAATKAALEHNDKLRSELEAERRLLQAARESAESSEKNGRKEEHLTLIDKVENKRCEILKKLDEIQALETEIKTTLVHTGILHITESRIKSIETEAIKLERTNTILTRKINVMENQVKRWLGKGIGEEEQRKLWGFIEEYIKLKETDDNSQVAGKTTHENSEASCP